LFKDLLRRPVMIPNNTAAIWTSKLQVLKTWEICLPLLQERKKTTITCKMRHKSYSYFTEKKIPRVWWKRSSGISTPQGWQKKCVSRIVTRVWKQIIAPRYDRGYGPAEAIQSGQQQFKIHLYFWLKWRVWEDWTGKDYPNHKQKEVWWNIFSHVKYIGHD